MIKLITFDNSGFRHYDFLVKTRSRMTTIISFFRQNDDGSRARRNLVLVVVLFMNLKVDRYYLGAWNRIEVLERRLELIELVVIFSNV